TNDAGVKTIEGGAGSRLFFLRIAYPRLVQAAMSIITIYCILVAFTLLDTVYQIYRQITKCGHILPYWSTPFKNYEWLMADLFANASKND
mgnify:CR=1